MLYVIFAILVLLFLFCYVCKKEFFESGNNDNLLSDGMRYTTNELSMCACAFLKRLSQDTKSQHDVIKINKAKRTSAFLTFEIFVQNIDKRYLKQYNVEAKLPLRESSSVVIVQYNEVQGKTNDLVGGGLDYCAEYKHIK